jgi:transcription initiation factor TFIIB
MSSSSCFSTTTINCPACIKYKVPNTDPMKYIVTVANKLNISEKTKRQTMSIMSEVARNEILTAGKDPIGLAAAVLYLSCIRTGCAADSSIGSGIGKNTSLVKISNAAGITDATLRNRFKDIKRERLLN